MELVLIAALSQNGVIGNGTKIPWFDAHGKSLVKSDLLRFQSLTRGAPIIMGRTTYEAIGKVLPGRQNIILSKNIHFSVPHATVVHSVDEALTLLMGPVGFIIGGASVFTHFLPHASRMELTIIEAHFHGDVFFPTYDSLQWHLVAREYHPANPSIGDHFAYRYETWRRKQ